MEQAIRKNSKKVYTGQVVSAINDKTITVKIDTYRRDKLYGKRVKYTKKFLVHDEQNLAKIGDLVKIMETKPFSKNKTFRLIEIKEQS